jgi:hypothetical protein
MGEKISPSGIPGRTSGGWTTRRSRARRAGHGRVAGRERGASGEAAGDHRGAARSAELGICDRARRERGNDRLRCVVQRTASPGSQRKNAADGRLCSEPGPLAGTRKVEETGNGSAGRPADHHRSAEGAIAAVGWPRDSWIVFNPRARRAVQEQRLLIFFSLDDCRMIRSLAERSHARQRRQMRALPVSPAAVVSLRARAVLPPAPVVLPRETVVLPLGRAVLPRGAVVLLPAPVAAWCWRRSRR